jgi:hypothetical protein
MGGTIFFATSFLYYFSRKGVIARAVSHSAEDFLSKDLQQLLHNRISLVLTLATPHRPVFVPDIYMAFFYYKLNCVYEREKQRRPEGFEIILMLFGCC